jgi:negative regulator of sigma E activity
MTDERPEDRTEDRQVERDSQLSAMFDGELPGGECELLARRLTRDEALRAQWSRYALIGAALRAERGVALNDRVAWRVQSAIAQEPAYGDVAAVDAPATTRATPAFSAATAARVTAYEKWLRFARPVVGAGIAAGVAAVSILWLRTQENPEVLLADAAVTESIVLIPEAMDSAALPAENTMLASAEPAVGGTGEPERYTTPAPSTQNGFAAPGRLANYVVAHSEYSGPLARRMALLGLVGNEAVAEGGEAPATEAAAAAGVADAP